ncbi:hypothetical protein CKAH01_18905 [Colletotrichum kahawae]|uniref:Uncharacterized protein n=1 Tax=Colletotrichum kahawae TaxID=34407 RepID=A0AAD9Y340_COLKA|nr:hypothetical protein CKAH01_18905 [Colletotrichum kahawae]
MWPLDGLRVRQLALAQLEGVDRWLATRYEGHEGRESVNARASCICTTTMLLLEATEAARRGVLGSSMTALESTANAELEWREHTITARESYGDLLKSFRQLLDFLNLGSSSSHLSYGKLVRALEKKSEPLNYDLLEWFRQEAVHYSDSNLLSYPQDEKTARREDSLDEGKVSEDASHFYENLKSVDTQLKTIIGPGYHTPEKYVNTHRALDRLGEIVVYHSEQEDNWPLWDRHSKGKEDEDGRELDDVIIYRYLLVTLLFRTALDGSEILKSNLWEQVVPIL